MSLGKACQIKDSSDLIGLFKVSCLFVNGYCENNNNNVPSGTFSIADIGIPKNRRVGGMVNRWNIIV